jgi:hypothetical protein
MERTVREDHGSSTGRCCDCIPQKEQATFVDSEVDRLEAGGGSEVGERKIGTQRSAVVLVTNPVAIHVPKVAVCDGVALLDLAPGFNYHVSNIIQVL